LGSLNIIFCSDEHLLGINRDFLQHDYYTDIITFDLSPSSKAPLEAELYISVDRVKENASSLGQPFYRELHRVIFHGLLHLMGYKDKQKKDQALMREMEDRLLADYFQ
jgi:rRNA maturation RNase YbeY